MYSKWMSETSGFIPAEFHHQPNILRRPSHPLLSSPLSLPSATRAETCCVALFAVSTDRDRLTLDEVATLAGFLNTMAGKESQVTELVIPKNHGTQENK